MRYMALWIAVLILSFPSHAFAQILPRNNLHVFDRLDGGNITEEQFHLIIDSIVDMWKPIARQYDAELVVTKKWSDSTVNAYAEQKGEKWMLHFFGGLARRAELTPDGFALVVCHELGHHFGGHYFYSGHLSWASVEGQADYFATQVCARRIWLRSERRNFRHLRDGFSTVQESCQQTWQTAEQVALCNRISDASLSLAKLLAVLSSGPSPKLGAKSTTTVRRTLSSHPEAQCRLDTYLAGALCPVRFNLSIIPGKYHPDGANSPAAEAEAAKYSCSGVDNFTIGARPRCWFKSQLVSDRFDDIARY